MTVSLLALPGEGRQPLLAKLEATVRAEFRVEVYWPDADDPALGGACAVADCHGLPCARGLCNAHYRRWRDAGRPEMAEFVASAPLRRRQRTPSRSDCFDLSALDGQLRLELAYVLQCRHDERAGRLNGQAFAHVVQLAADSGCASLLEWPVDAWLERMPGSARTRVERHAVVRYAWRVVEDLAVGANPDDVYACNVWDARRLGMPEHARSGLRVRFDRISPDWLRETTKRWVRFRLAGEKALSTARADTGAIASFSQFLTARHIDLAHPSLGRPAESGQ